MLIILQFLKRKSQANAKEKKKRLKNMLSLASAIAQPEIPVNRPVSDPKRIKHTVMYTCVCIAGGKTGSVNVLTLIITGW